MLFLKNSSLKENNQCLPGMSTHTIIVGASAAGLACAACLTKAGISYILLEQQPHVAHAWRNHYDRLHLNTPKKHSCLPYLKFPENTPVFVSKKDVVLYLEEYARVFNILPLFNQQVVSIRREGTYWIAATNQDTFSALNIIIATGYNRQPFIPYWEGMENYKGAILHSSLYKNGEHFKGKPVLVVGFGNSACEIGICLHEHGAYPSLSVKDAVNIISRAKGDSKIEDFFDSFAWVSRLAPGLIDSINAPSLKARFGNLESFGLRKLPYGPNVQIVKYNRVPLLDIGTFELIKKGVIKIYPAVKNFNENTVCFTNGTEQYFEAVILGTGYRSALSDFLPDTRELFDSEGKPLSSGIESFLPGLYFCGFKTSPLGMLREIGREAKNIVQSIRKKQKKPVH